MLALVAAGLFVSGVTVWPAIPELKLLIAIVWGNAAPTGELHRFILEVIAALDAVNRDYPFLLYGYDWLAFAHICLAILFAGSIRDPVRNIWVVQCGLIMCALVPILAGVCIPLRGMPTYWFLIRTSGRHPLNDRASGYQGR